MEKKTKSGNKSFKKNSKFKSTLSDPNVRTPCNCEATEHPLVNNCLNCGRIVCSREGPGLCFFCGNMVDYNKRQPHPLDFPKEVDYKSKEPCNKNKDVNPVESLKLRDKLLQYDKDFATQTNVIDDECDYYQANNNWLTKSQREQWEKLASETYEQKHKSRTQQNLKFDLTGRVYREEEDPVELYKKMNAIQVDRDFEFLQSSQPQYNHFQSLQAAVYVGNNSLPSNKTQKIDTNYTNRIQDHSLLEISDQGVCLSLHQPYASLLVRGIKKIEGRTWYTSHRGRLWIASAVREARPEEIKSLEDSYREGNEDIEFPKTYPTGCLLGCVTITDVLSEEEYIKLHPNETVSSPYIFVCENFIELHVKYPIQGKHKIYKLDRVIHRAAVTCLENMFKLKLKSDH